MTVADTVAAINAALDRRPDMPFADRLRELHRLRRALRWMKAEGIVRDLSRLLLGLDRHRPKPSAIRAMRCFVARAVLTTRVGVITPEHHRSRRRKLNV